MSPHEEFPRNRGSLFARFGPLGECASGLIAVHALATGLWWFSAEFSWTAWLMQSFSLWLVLRTCGFNINQHVSRIVTACTIVIGFAICFTLPETLPASLRMGPFSPFISTILLCGVLMVDLGDLVWPRR